MLGGLKIGQLALQPWVDIFRGAEKLTLIWFWPQQRYKLNTVFWPSKKNCIDCMFEHRSLFLKWGFLNNIQV